MNTRARIVSWDREDVTDLWKLIKRLPSGQRRKLTTEEIPSEPIPPELAQAARKRGYPIWARDKSGIFLAGEDFSSFFDLDRLWEEMDIIDFVREHEAGKQRP
jgi:hypothetical protein